MDTDLERSEDLLVANCYRDHHGAPEPECSHCTGPRAQIQRCAYCDGVYEDGRWYTDQAGNTRPVDCHHEPTNLMNDWGQSLHCEAHELGQITVTKYDGSESSYMRSVQCADDVAKPGKRLCVFHQAIADKQLCAAELPR